MIARLSGTVWSVGEDHVVVRVGGIGIRVRVPPDAPAQLGDVGQPVELFTHLHVRENELALYGFLTQEELALFKLLLSVSGVGPKVALALLGVVSPDALRQAVTQENPALLSRAPGVGPKTAKSIIFHLKDKLIPTGAQAAPLLSDADAQVIAALTGLGFSLVEAQTALQSLPKNEDLSIEEQVRQALTYFAAP
ncbi:MAG: Holliday junction branch migration protein RuvA [Chloroflexi bacterium]|nr:MAG: Holliday junction branch migration protein RuvA [Chloroflexota bacterium]RLC81159.1 MAG: Holliday junction branch migration protein RuvA [Chloroflexota bacterium]